MESVIATLGGEQMAQPIFVKGIFGRRIIVSQFEQTSDFILQKKNADLIKEASGFSKNKKLFTRYQGKDFQIMEQLKWQPSVLFDDASKNRSSHRFKDTNGN